ncbi:unnamed protein product [Rotaria sp. Silwood2]|nr:unnamed protein product [Rotaria sp. Silwood2]
MWDSLKRKAKDAGNANRQLCTFMDNLSSTSSECQPNVISTQVTDDDMPYYDKAPITCTYFKSICTDKSNFDYEKTSLNYLCFNKFISGGEKKLVNNDGKEILLKIQKEKDERLSHDKAGLISMSIYDCTTRFFITLNLVTILYKTNVVFGEITHGMDMIHKINQLGIRKVYEFNPGQICGDGGTGDIVYHDQDDIAGEPKDTVLVYACGER